MGVYKTGSGKWGYSIQRGHHRIRRTVGTKQEAQEAYLRAKQSMPQEQSSGVRLHQWMGQCIRAKAPKVAGKTLESYYNSFGHLVRLLPDVDLDTLTGESIENYIRERQKTAVTNATINRELMFLSMCYRRAMDLDLITYNPCSRKALTETSEPPRFLTADEITALLQTCREPTRSIVEVAIFSGLRMREIFSLRRSDLGGSVLHVHRKWKDRKMQAVRVSDRVRETLLRQPTNGVFFFPNAAGGQRRSCRTAFEKALNRAGLEDVNFHTLRHTFASHAVMNGMPLRTLQEILGHTKLDMVLRYAHLAPSHVDDVLAKVTKRLEVSMEIDPKVSNSGKTRRKMRPSK